MSEEEKFAKDNVFFPNAETTVEDDGHVTINTTVNLEGRDGSVEQKQVTISFAHSSAHDPTYESEEMKFIKQSGLVPEDEIKFENGYMHFKDGGFSIDDPWSRDFNYRMKYIKNRNEKTKESLQDKQYINFDHIDYDSDLEDDEWGGINDANEDKYGYPYQDFLDKKEVSFKNPDEIVLAQSYMELHFNSPTYRDHVTFTLHADDEIKGFTRKELAHKCMQYYHLQFYLCQNYDMNKGCFTINKAANQVYNKHSELNEHLEAQHAASGYNMDWMNQEPPKDFKLPEPLFRPVLFYDEYTDNGLCDLEYNKQKEYWIFNCINSV